MNKPLLLIILDGFGIAEEYGNAIKAANKPNLDRIFQSKPNHTNSSFQHERRIA